MSIGRWVFQNGGVPTKQLLVFVGERDPEFTYLPSVSISSLIYSSEREMVAERDYPPPCGTSKHAADANAAVSTAHASMGYGTDRAFILETIRGCVHAHLIVCTYFYISWYMLEREPLGNAGISVLGSYSIHHHDE